MKTVSRFESNLLRIVHGIVQRAPLEQVFPLVQKRVPRPNCLRREAVELLQEALAKGTVWFLAREGWRHERYLRGSQVREGRLWQRSTPGELGLSFSRNTLEFLMWLTAQAPDDPPPGLPPEEPTLGDMLLFFLTYRLLRTTEAGKALRQFWFVAGNGLCLLHFPEDFADCSPNLAPDWSLWTTGAGSCILECLQTPLAKRWVESELKKGQMKSTQRMRAAGTHQERVLQGFCQAASGAQRWDLTRFLLLALVQVLPENVSAEQWIGGLDMTTLRLADRTETYRAALVLLRQLEPMQKWERQARTIGYFDEGYAACQLWKADWERSQGDELCRRAEIVLREVEPLKSKGDAHEPGLSHQGTGESAARPEGE